MADVVLRKVEYWQKVRPPTLKQYLLRRHVGEVMASLKGGVGTGLDIDTGRPAPLTAIAAKAKLKGIRADEIARLHPEWVADFASAYPEGG